MYSVDIMNVLDICVTLVEIKLTRCLFVLWSLVLLICKYSVLLTCLLDTDVLFNKYLSIVFAGSSSLFQEMVAGNAFLQKWKWCVYIFLERHQPKVSQANIIQQDPVKTIC